MPFFSFKHPRTSKTVKLFADSEAEARKVLLYGHVWELTLTEMTEGEREADEDYAQAAYVAMMKNAERISHQELAEGR